jgi:hypothetical protein
MTSSSEEDITDKQTTNNDWQKVRSTKRKKLMKNHSPTPYPTETTNRFNQLLDQADCTSEEIHATQKKDKPPPIFIHGVQNYEEMVKHIQLIAEQEQYITKSLANNVVKINCENPDTYRKMIKEFQAQNIYHHTYQLKEERAFRIVIRYLHHSTNLDSIKQELAELGHKVRNIINARHKITKEPLNLFFVELEPAPNNKTIYDITGLQNRIINIEPPRSNKSTFPQCTRCQNYGHTKTYCNRPYACVKCSGPHKTSDCTKTRDTPATCVHCGGDHPANYKGCEHYRKLSNKPANTTRRINPATPIHTTESYLRPPLAPTQKPPTHRSYAEITRPNLAPPENPTTILSKVLDEFKNLLQQLLQQNTLVLNMLTTLVNKLH